LPAPSTTTTVPGGSVPIACDDADPCTEDHAGPGGGCQHVVRTGLDGATCRLATLAALLHGVPARALGGRRLAARLRRSTAAAERLVDAARRRPARAMPRLRRAASTLASFDVAVRRAERRGRLERVLAESMRALAAEASAQIARTA